VCGQEHDFFSGFHNALLNAACKHITHTFDFVDARNWHPHWCTGWAFWNTAHFVEAIVNSIYVNVLLADSNIGPLPPSHVVRLFQEVVTHPT